MKPDFALEDSLTFNAVLPWSHFSTAGGKGNRDAASSKLLQEKVRIWYDVLLFSLAVTTKNLLAVQSTAAVLCLLLRC